MEKAQCPQKGPAAPWAQVLRAFRAPQPWGPSQGRAQQPGPILCPIQEKGSWGIRAVPAPSPGTALGLGRGWAGQGWRKLDLGPAEHSLGDMASWAWAGTGSPRDGAGLRVPPGIWKELSILPFKCKWNVFSKNTPVRKTKIWNYVHVESGKTEIPRAPSSFNIYIAVKCILSLLNLWVMPSPPAPPPLPGSAAI